MNQPRVDAGSRVAVLAARLLAVAATVLVAVALALPLLTRGRWLPELFATPEPVVAPSFALTGALLAGHRRARPLGWLLLAIGLSAAVYVLATSWSLAWGAADGAAGGGGAGVAAWLRAWSWLPALLLTCTVLPQVLPHGRPLPGPWRVPAAAGLVLTVVSTVLVALLSSPTDRVQPFASPVFTVPLALLLVAGPVSLVVRARRAGPDQRRQLAWVGYGVTVAVLATFLAPPWLVSLAVLLVPATMAVAALRYRLYDIDVVVSRSVVGAVLLAGTALAYATLVAWSQVLLGDRAGAAPVVATFLVALAFHPAYVRVQRVVDRVVRGRRGDPYALVTQVQSAVRDAPTAREGLAGAVRELRRGLRVPGVVVEVALPDGGAVRTSDGDPGAAAEAVPLRLHGTDVGVLRVALTATGLDGPDGPDGRTAGPRVDRRLLDALVAPVVTAAWAVRAADDLERSRQALVTAREDERRRLRRDLHDGLGPQMSSVVMTMDTARSALRRGDDERATVLLADAGAQAEEAVRDVRRLVHGLRPPSLDDLGLAGALRASAAGLTAAGGPDVLVDADDARLRGLPAATEVAVLRIALEAVHNAVRHARASTVRARVTVDGQAVRVEVTDDGRGLPVPVVPGVGLASMRERATELGGWCDVGPAEPSGTRVVAVVPLRPGTSGEDRDEGAAA